MRTGNPALNDKVFANSVSREGGSVMTLQGAVYKTAILVAIVFAGAVFTWREAEAGFVSGRGLGTVAPFAIGGLIGGLVFCLVTCFNPRWSPVTAPLYAVCEGLFLGVFSAFAENIMRAKGAPGVVIPAILLTLGILFALLLAYTSRLIRATENFKLGVVAATGGIFIVYLVGFIMSFFGMRIPYIHESGLIGIGFSVFVCVVASLNLVLDFDFIERGAEAGAPKHMEWYAAFGLLVTLIWLYVELVRLLMKLNSRK